MCNQNNRECNPFSSISTVNSHSKTPELDFVTKNVEMFVARVAKGGAVHESEIEALALDALGLVRNELLVSLRFMSAAFARLAPLPIPGATLATDGAHLRFDPVTWARTYAADPAEASRAYLHTVLHCVFLHLYPGEGIDPDLWDIACDMVVESVIDQLDLPATRTAQAAASRPELERMAEEAGLMTAERIYAALRDRRGAGATDDELARLGARFHVDDHRPWHAVVIAEGEEASGKTGEASEGEGRTSAPAAKADASGTDMDIPDEAADAPYSHKAHRAMDAADTLEDCYVCAAGMIATMTVNADAMAAQAKKGYLAATDVADYLAKKGLPFRRAHEIVGHLVLLCDQRGCDLEDLTLDDFKAESDLFESDIVECLNLPAIVAARTTFGGTAPEAVRVQLAAAKAQL